MIIYLINPLISLVLIGIGRKLYENKKNLNSYIVYITLVSVTFIITWSIMGFRDVGADRANYINHFKLMKSMENFNVLYDFEVGYNFIIYILTRVCSKEVFLFILTSFITLFGVYCFCFKYSRYPELSIFLYLTLGLFYTSFAVIRQFIALAIILYGIKYIYSRNFLKYSIVVIIATLFHSTSLIMLILYFLNPKIIYKYKFFIIIISCFLSIFSLEILNLLFLILKIIGIDYVGYLSKSYLLNGSNILHVLIQGAIVIWQLFFIKKFYINFYYNDNIKNANKDNIIGIAYVGSFVSLILMIFSTQIDLISRLNLFFSFFNVITIPFNLKYFDKYNKMVIYYIIIVVVLIYTYFLLTLKSTNIITPYQSIFNVI